MSQDQIENILTKYPKGLTAKQMSKKLNLTIGSVHKNLKGMKKSNELNWTDDWIPIYTLRSKNSFNPPIKKPRKKRF